MRKQDEEWVAVASTGQDEEAMLIAGFLESRDIPCEVEGPTGGSPWPENLGAFGMSRVMVPPERAEEAKAILAKREGEAPLSTDGESESE
jgi:hypothetical protein